MDESPTMSVRAYSHWLIAAVSGFSLPIFAQSNFIVTPSQIPGIHVAGPETPEFAKHLADLGADLSIEVAAATPLSRAIVVTNNTDRRIAKFVVRYDYLNERGRMIYQINWQEEKAGYAPRTSRLITASQLLADGIRLRSRDLTLKGAQTPLHATVLRSPLVRVAVDSVLFADGEFAGPDVSSAFTKLTEEQAFVRATRIALGQIGPDVERIRQKLAEIHKPLVDRKPVPGEGSRVRTMRRVMFGTLDAALNRGGYEGFRATLQAQFGEQALPVLRRK